MKKVAIPIASGVISEYLGKCSHFVFLDMESKNLNMTKNDGTDFNNSKKVGLWIKNNGITDLITHRIDKDLIDILSSEKINLFVGVPLVSAEQIIQAYRCGTLESDYKIIAEIIN